MHLHGAVCRNNGPFDESTYATPETNEFHENSMNLFVFDRNYDDGYMGAPMHDVSIHVHNDALRFFLRFIRTARSN